jgi:hypothetical protein
MDGRKDGSVTISPRNFVGEGIINLSTYYLKVSTQSIQWEKKCIKIGYKIKFCIYMYVHEGRLRVMEFNATFNNISVISWQSVLMVEETRVPRENHRHATSH